MHPFLDHPTPIAFAHRGGSLEVEENTLAAFAHAEALGYTHIETDVRVTRDGVPVIFHDETLERMAGRPERIADLDWDDLRKIRLNAGNTIPCLDEIFDAFKGMNFNLEAKSVEAARAMVDTLKVPGRLDRICIGSFVPEATTILREALGDICWSPAHAGVFRIWLAGFGLPARVAFNVLQVPTHYRGIPVVTRRFIRAAHKRGLHVHVWTVDEAPEMERLLDLGVDGIMTDRPTLLLDVLRGRGDWQS